MSQNPLNAKALRAAIEAARNAEENCDPAIEAAIRAYIASQEAAAPSEEPVAWNPDWTPEFDEMVAADPILSRAASIICGAACGSYSHCLSREAAVALRDAGLLASPAVAPVEVSVKPLQWRDHSFKESMLHTAEMPYGQYSITYDSDCEYPFVVRPFVTKQSNYETLEDAKADCEIDYRERIVSSIIPATKGGETHRHLKSGHLVRVIGTGKMQSANWRTCPFGQGITSSFDAPVDMREVVIYEHDGNLWVRPVEEFNDGRFAALSAQDTDGVAK